MKQTQQYYVHLLADSLQHFGNFWTILEIYFNLKLRNFDSLRTWLSRKLLFTFSYMSTVFTLWWKIFVCKKHVSSQSEKILIVFFLKSTLFRFLFLLLLCVFFSYFLLIWFLLNIKSSKSKKCLNNKTMLICICSVWRNGRSILACNLISYV